LKTVVVRHELPEWTDWYVERLRAEFPGFDFRAAHTAEEAMAQAPEAQVFIGLAPQMTPALVAAMRRLEWVQSLTSGVDNLLSMKEMPAHVPITVCAGVQGPQMSEHALMLMLALARRLPETLRAQALHRWERRPQPVLVGKTVCLLGLGSIAETLAARCKALGMIVTGVSRRASAPDVDRIFPRERLREAAAEADFLVVLVPLSPETRHIVDVSVLSAMKPSAYLVNLARGGCVDETALLQALRSGTIAGAGIDVFETEPLPPDSPLWEAPNAILTPHVGGFAEIYHEQCYPIVRDNFRVYAEGGAEALRGALRRKG
jgi:D-2-hydroxyacid dehydrogenase (NADP+)